jgi:hypothetical protein
MQEKVQLYLAAGAVEVWICWESRIEFYDKSGQIVQSNYDVSVKLPK